LKISSNPKRVVRYGENRLVSCNWLILKLSEYISQGSVATRLHCSWNL